MLCVPPSIVYTPDCFFYVNPARCFILACRCGAFPDSTIFAWLFYLVYELTKYTLSVIYSAYKKYPFPVFYDGTALSFIRSGIETYK